MKKAGKNKGEPLSLDHLGELTGLLIHTKGLERKLGFARPARANTWGDLVRWGYVEERALGHPNPRVLTERGENLLRRVATVLAGAGYYKAVCPGCKKVWRIEDGAEDPRCDCLSLNPFRVIPESISKMVDENFGKRRKK